MVTVLHEQEPHIPPQAQAVLELHELIDPAAPVEQQVVDEAEVLHEVEKIDQIDARLTALYGLWARAKDRRAIAEAIEMEQDIKYGRSLIETTAHEAPVALERMLEGKNPALVLRGDELEAAGITDTEAYIAQLMDQAGGFQKVGVDHFPKRGMKFGSSTLHLDNFIQDEENPGFRYTASAAVINKGSVLFISGTARKNARDISHNSVGTAHPYEQARYRVESDPQVQSMYGSAMRGKPQERTDIVTHENTPLTSIVLHEGDVAIWSQGGEGSGPPSWHAFRQIGTEPRQSTSIHFARPS